MLSGAMDQDLPELDFASLQCIFSCLADNYVILIVKPLNKHFRE